jgi:cytochrome P450
MSYAVSKTFLPFEAIPGPRPLPLVGNIWRYLPLIGDYDVNNLFGNAKINKSKYGPIVREQITKQHCVLHLFDPNDIGEFYRHDSNKPHRRSHRALMKLRRDNQACYNDGGMFPENGSTWSRLRRSFQQSLMNRASLTKRAKILDQVTTRFIDSINGHREQPVRVDKFEQFLYRWSVSCSLAIFLDYTNQPVDDGILDQIIICSSDQLDALAYTEIQSDRWMKHPDKCPYYQKLVKSDRSMYELVKHRIDCVRERLFYETDNVSFLRDWLIEAKLDPKDVITFLIDSILANVHTTVYTCVYLLEDISKRMDSTLKGQLLKEVSTVETIPNDVGDYASFVNEKMPTMRDCLRETLRLHPVSIGTGRLTQFDMKLRNYHIPAGIMVIAHNQTICLDPKIYEDPDEFRPDRWTRPKSQQPPPAAWLPFGLGSRACIGQHLVRLELYILTMRLLQRFDLKFLNEIKTRTTLVHQLDGHVAVELKHVGANRK